MQGSAVGCEPPPRDIVILNPEAEGPQSPRLLPFLAPAGELFGDSVRLVEIDRANAIPFEPGENLVRPEQQLSSAGTPEMGDLVEPVPDHTFRERKKGTAKAVEIEDARHAFGSLGNSSAAGRARTAATRADASGDSFRFPWTTRQIVERER